MNLLSAFDFTQLFGDTAAFDGNAGTGSTGNLPFVSVSDPLGTGTGQVVAQPSSFWSNISNGLAASLPAVLNNLTGKSDPNPTAAAKEQQTTAAKLAAQKSSSLLKYALIGLAIVVTLGIGWWLMRPRKGK